MNIIVDGSLIVGTWVAATSSLAKLSIALIAYKIYANVLRERYSIITPTGTTSSIAY